MNSSGNLKRMLDVLYRSKAVIDRRKPDDETKKAGRLGIWSFEDMPGNDPEPIIGGATTEFTDANNPMPSTTGSRVVAFRGKNGKMVKGTPSPENHYSDYTTNGS